MAISKVNLAASGDTVYQGFEKYNNTVDKLVTGGTQTNGILTLNQYDGNVLTIPTASVANEVIYGGEYAIFSGNSLQVIVQPVTYNCDGVTYSITSATTLNISAGDPSLPRIDIIVGETLSNLEIIEGTPSATPVAEQITNVQTKVGLIYVDPNASSSGGTSVVQFVQSFAGTPNNTVRINANGDLVETDNLTNNGTDLTIKTGATINVSSNLITGNDLTIQSNNNLDIFSDTFINVGVASGFDINQLTVDVNSVNINATAGTGDFNIAANNEIDIDGRYVYIDSIDAMVLNSEGTLVLDSQNAMTFNATGNTLDINVDTLLAIATTEIQLDAPQTQVTGTFWNTAGIKRNITTPGAAYTATTANDVIFVSGSNAVSIPAASASTAFQLTIIKTDGAGTNTITPVSGNINGSATDSLTTYGGRIYISNGSNWFSI